MDYYIREETGTENNALSKARSDANQILRDMGLSPLAVRRQQMTKSRLKRILFTALYAFIDWRKVGRHIEQGTNLILPFPLVNNLHFNNRVAETLRRLKETKGIRLILLIHDIDSLRFSDDHALQYEQEKRYFSIADVCIAHNDAMKRYLQKEGMEVPIVTLGIFDYLYDRQPVYKRRETFCADTPEVVIAGNMDREKTAYLGKLKQIDGVRFHLYGPNYSETTAGQNTEYFGVYPPEELPEHIRGDFGLIWDGDSLEACSGDYGAYLRYNNPHKTSFYLSLGLPVIVWEQAAIAEFVTSNRVGIAISDLRELKKRLAGITKAEYAAMCAQAENLARQLRGGYYLRHAVSEALELMPNG